MSTDHPDIAEQLLRGQRRQTRAIVLVFLALVLLGGYVWRQQARTNKALCTLQADLVQRVQSETDFITKHPHGIPGVSVASIRASITGQERTIQALAPLQCTVKGTPP